MFENIIGHENVILQLKNQVARGTVPSALLIEGPEYCGKSTLAAELARVIVCKGDKSQNCSCSSCCSHRYYLNPDILFIGGHRFMEEINFCRQLLEKNNNEASRILFVQAVQKLIRRFDPVFVDDHDSKFKKIQDSLTALEPLVQEINSENYSFIPEKKKLQTIEKLCLNLVNDSNLGMIPVQQLRKIIFWCHTTSLESKKITIIENCEKMNDSARNSMLKVLEEPPENAFFILTTSRIGEIIPTIKSRLRIYNLKKRTPKEDLNIIQNIFYDTSGVCSGVQEYIELFDENAGEINHLAVRFLNFYLSSQSDFQEKNSLKQDLKLINSENIKIYFEKILNNSRKLNLNDNFFKLQKLNKIISESWYNFETLNMNPTAILENLLYFAGNK